MKSITAMYKGAIVGCGAVACQAHVPAWRTVSAFRIVAAVDLSHRRPDQRRTDKGPDRQQPLQPEDRRHEARDYHQQHGGVCQQNHPDHDQSQPPRGSKE